MQADSQNSNRFFFFASKSLTNNQEEREKLRPDYGDHYIELFGTSAAVRITLVSAVPHST